MVNVEPVEPAAKKKKRLSRLEERRAARVEAELQWWQRCGRGPGSGSEHADRAKGVGVLGGEGTDRREWLHLSGVLTLAGH